MMSVTLLTRADDFGSARAANRAILEGVHSGVMLRNVSCMAVAPYICEGAEALRSCKGVDIGLHAVLNSEWESLRWGPLSHAGRHAGVTDETGNFCSSAAGFDPSRLSVENILAEYDAQLELLTRLGLKVSYVDSHMLPEFYVPGLLDAFRSWIAAKGLVDALDFYHMPVPPVPPYVERNEDWEESIGNWLQTLPANQQYWYLMHPVQAGDESMSMCNADIPAGYMYRTRHQDYLSTISPRWADWQQQLELHFVRYTQAVKQAESIQEIKRLLGK